MIEPRYHPDFLKQAKRLPRPQQIKLVKLLATLKENPFDSRLHTKRLSVPLAGMLSFRITRGWRALFQFIDEKTILLVDVGHRDDIYR